VSALVRVVLREPEALDDPLAIGRFRAQRNALRCATGNNVVHVFKLDLSEGSRTAAASTGLRFVDWLSLPRGRHQVRFAVHQPNGKTGMVVGDVEVPDFADTPVSMSGPSRGATCSRRTARSTRRGRHARRASPPPSRAPAA
jgi:hypothetical protein